MYQNTFACRITKGNRIPQEKVCIHEQGALSSRDSAPTWTEPGWPWTTTVQKETRQVRAAVLACLSFPGSSTTQPQPNSEVAASRQQVTNAVLDTLKLIGVDTCHYSGISMRRGGISAGLACPSLFCSCRVGTDPTVRHGTTCCHVTSTFSSKRTWLLA